MYQSTGNSGNVEVPKHLPKIRFSHRAATTTANRPATLCWPTQRPLASWVSSRRRTLSLTKRPVSASSSIFRSVEQQILKVKQGIFT